MKPPAPFHPLVVALFPVASLYARNMALIPWTDTIRPAAIALGLACLVWAVLWLVVRDLRRAAVGTSVALALLFAFEHLINLGLSKVIGTEYGAKENFAPWYIGLTLAAVIFTMWRVRSADRATGALNTAATVLALMAAGNIGVSAWGIQNNLSQSRQAGAPTTRVVPSGPGLPDVYYIVLDGYGRSDAVARAVGLDDSGFIRELRERGFHVLDQSVANYNQTELSLASTLNMDLVQSLLPNMPPDASDRAPLDRLINDSRVSRTFKQLGYSTIAVGTGFPGFSFKTADAFLENAPGTSIFESAWLATTPLSQARTTLQSQYDSRRESIDSAFSTLSRLAPRAARPKFVVAHLLVPHPPFVFGPEGQRVPRPKGTFGLWDGSHYLAQVGSAQSYRDGYRDQARYTAKRVLEVVRSLQSGSRVPPVIILQGDHGPKVDLDQDSAKPNALDEVFPILNAVYAPEIVTERLAPWSTPVNTFRAVFSGLFGDDLSPLPDRSFYASWPAPYRWTEVTESVSPAQSAKRVAASH